MYPAATGGGCEEKTTFFPMLREGRGRMPDPSQ
jgi:hypothetical protein